MDNDRPAGTPAATTAWRWRRWGFAAVVALGMYWPAAFVFLNTSLGEWVVNGGWSSRPRKVRLHWASGASWWPGRLRLAGVELVGESRRMEWQLSADEATGRLVLSQLFGRRVLLRQVEGRGARFAIASRAVPADEPVPRPRRWSVELPEIELRQVRELGFGDLHLAGDALARGGFRYQAGMVSLENGSIVLRSGKLDAKSRELAHDLTVEARAVLSPYVPREQPGALGLDFLTGTLTASGAAGAGPDSFRAKLSVDQGRLETGSELAYRHTEGAARLHYAGRVSPAPVSPGQGADVLHLSIDATNLVVGPRIDAPPLLESGELRVTAKSDDTRLSSLFGRAQELQSGSAARPLEGELVARDLRLRLLGDRFTGELAVDQATGRLDLGAFLHRELVLGGLRAEGGQVRVETLAQPASPQPTPRPWALRFGDAQLNGLSAVRFDAFTLSGPASLATSFAFAPDGALAIERLALSLPQGTLLEAREALARRVALELAAEIEPVAASELAAAPILAGLSATVTTRAEVTSLGFLRHWLGRNPWLGLEGRGRLSATLSVDHGRLVPGSRLEVEATAIEAQILGSVARGHGRIHGEVRGGKGEPRLELEARLDRFTVENEVRERLLDGAGLEIEVSSAEAVRLGAPPKDVRAIVHLDRATLPDFAIFNPLLPGGAEVELLPGAGTLGLRLELDGKTQSGRGRLSLHSERARVRLQELVIGGRLHVDAPLATNSFAERRFNLAGTRLTLDPGSYHELGDEPGEPTHGWWARMELPEAELTMGRPVQFESLLALEMKDSGPFLALFAQKRRYLNWFSQVLLVEGVKARAKLALGSAGFALDPLEVEAETMTMVSRMRFSAGAKEGDLFLTYGKLEVGIELRDGKRDFKILNPRKWLETWHRPP